MFNVIIVEDDPMVASLNRQYLERVSDNLHIAAAFPDGKSAFNYLCSHQVDLVILDVYMPMVTGLELLKMIRAKDLPVDVIMVTAANNSEEVSLAFNYGVTDYLVKPFDYTRFAQAIDKFLQKKTVLSSDRVLSQENIDKVASSPVLPLPGELEKGLQPITLNKILDAISNFGARDFTCKEISDMTSLSVVTSQRYLSYLVNKKQLKTTIDYNTGGRPKLLYRKNI